MNRTDRLLSMVLELQFKGTQTAENIATTFEISKRTVYRDIQALSESGVPIISLPGTGYSLAKNYFLPPVSFSVDEATILLLGLDFIKNSFDEEYNKLAKNTEKKISVILPEKLKTEVQEMKKQIKLLFINDFLNNEKLNNSTLQIIRTAILKKKIISFIYYSKSLNNKTTMTDRNVNPYKLVFLNNIWYLSGYCNFRNDLRNFRLDRIEGVKITDKNFEMPENLDFNNVRQDNRTIIAKLNFNKSIARWVKESNFYFIEQIVDKQDFLEVTLKIRNDEDIIEWVLSWGANVTVVEPESLKTKLILEVKKILANY